MAKSSWTNKEDVDELLENIDNVEIWNKDYLPIALS